MYGGIINRILTPLLTDKQESSCGSLKALPPSQEPSNGHQSTSVTANTKPKKKIILVRKKSLKTSEKLPVKPTGNQKATGTLNADEEKVTETLGLQNGKPERVAAEDERADSPGRGEAKRRKLLQTSDEDAVALRSIAAPSASTQRVGPPPDLDVVCIERSVPLEEEQGAGSELVEEPGTSEDTTGRDSEKILRRLSSGKKRLLLCIVLVGYKHCIDCS